MSSEILSEEAKRDLAENIRKNGGVVLDENFKELEIYLERNPKEKILDYLDN